MASAGHSGSQTPQSMHSSGWMTSMFLALVEAVDGADFNAVVYLHLMQASGRRKSSRARKGSTFQGFA